MSMRKIRKDDTIIVITGKNKGKVGKIIQVFPKEQKIIVEGINMVSKHVKANPQQQIEGGITQKEMPIHISNVAILNLNTNKPSRVGFRTLTDGRKIRYFKSDGKEIDV